MISKNEEKMYQLSRKMLAEYRKVEEATAVLNELKAQMKSLMDEAGQTVVMNDCVFIKTVSASAPKRVIDEKAFEEAAPKQYRQTLERYGKFTSGKAGYLSYTFSKTKEV